MDPVDIRWLTVLSEISRISTSSADLTRKLQHIIEVIMRSMGKEGASAFLLDRDGRNVTMVAAAGLNQEIVGKLTFPLGSGIAGWVAEQKVPLALRDPYSDPRFQYVPGSGIEHFRSLIAAPVLDDERCLGVLFVLSREPWSAATPEVTLLATAANQISGVIKSTELIQSLQARYTQLTMIHEIGLALTSTLDLGQLLSLIANHTTRALRAQGCAIRLVGPRSEENGRPAGPDKLVGDAVRELDSCLGEPVLARVVAGRRPILVTDSAQDPELRTFTGCPSCTLISVPLLFREHVTGVITLYNRLDGLPYEAEDLQFLATIASGAAAAVENAAMFERTERLAAEARSRAQEFQILYDIGAAMSATLNLDRVLRIILTAATMGGSGLGFNRAILLLTNERTHVLQGMMGVGPTTWDEADRAWTEVARRHHSLLEWVQTGELFESRDSEINAIARSIRVRLEPTEGVLALTVLEQRPFNVLNATADPLVKREIREALRVESFATVPLVAKSRAIGAILVDNLFTRRPITDHDIRFLTMFAHQAALAIDNAVSHSNIERMNKDIRLMHEQLAQSEKMAALGEMMAEITHEIRNPLVSIGGFTRRLARRVEDTDAKRYIDIILGEVKRLEDIIHDNLAYIKNAAPQLGLHSLNPVIEEVLEVYEEELRQRGIRLERQLGSGIPELTLDAAQIKQAVINVLTNALEAMERGGVLTVETRPLPESREAVIEIGDTGPGIATEAMHNLWNPYYTTKVRGTGLGLPITHRIIKVHRGTIKVRNKETGGALFSIRLPWPQEAA